jgi:hypothetical protein
MNDQEMKAFISSRPSEQRSLAVQALWFDRQGDWQKAHELAQQADSRDGDWVHAYLHRKEGDEANAAYWYARAGKAQATVTLEQEWESLVRELHDKANEIKHSF